MKSRRAHEPMIASGLMMLLLAVSATAQDGKLKTSVQQDSARHTTIVIHDNRPEAYSRRDRVAQQSFSLREAERQRMHEIELAKIQANAQVQVARAQQNHHAAPSAALAPQAPREPRRPSFFNGGQWTGLSAPVFAGPGFGFPGFGLPGFGFGGFPGYCPTAAYPACPPAPPTCR